MREDFDFFFSGEIQLGPTTLVKYSMNRSLVIIIRPGSGKIAIAAAAFRPGVVCVNILL